MMMSRKTPSLKRTAIRKFMAGEDGAALVEFTILAPMVVAMSIYTMDFGLIFYNKMTVQDAAQAGVQWAITNRVFNSLAIGKAADNGTFNVTVSQFCGCPSTTGVTLIPPNNSACPGGTTCPDGSTAGTYVTVTAASKTPYKFILFGLISSTYNFSATSTARIQ
jgi:Flp pilus assembly protein TadG